jgi:hypothetical protein
VKQYNKKVFKKIATVSRLQRELGTIPTGYKKNIFSPTVLKEVTYF